MMTTQKPKKGSFYHWAVSRIADADDFSDRVIIAILTTGILILSKEH